MNLRSLRGGRMCRRSDRRRQRGILLVDCVIYIALLALILDLAFACFYRTLEHSTQLERNATDILSALRAGERWREDVRAASGPLQIEARAAETVLRIPRAPGGEVRYVLRDHALQRQEVPGGQREELLSRVRTSQFHRDPHQYVTAWRWELELERKQSIARVTPGFTFQAVARGEPKR